MIKIICAFLVCTVEPIKLARLFFLPAQLPFCRRFVHFLGYSAILIVADIVKIKMLLFGNKTTVEYKIYDLIEGLNLYYACWLRKKCYLFVISFLFHFYDNVQNLLFC